MFAYIYQDEEFEFESRWDWAGYILSLYDAEIISINIENDIVKVWADEENYGEFDCSSFPGMDYDTQVAVALCLALDIEVPEDVLY
jgi:hypothetical protein